jgi:uncharacterized protein involved in exopolysaccharide biosynthesis/Mrp family chromosome partitioning ATPase
MNSAVIANDASYATEPKRAPPSALTLRELLTPVFYYRRRALLAFLIPLALAVLACLFAHPVFVAQSRLLILLGGDYVFKGAPNDPGSSQSFDRAQIVHAEMEILSAPDLHADAIKAVGLARVYPGLADQPSGVELAANRLDKDLTIDNVPLSNVIELKLRNRDPKVAAQLLNKLVELYVERRREVFKRADPSSIAVQKDAIRQRLAALETQLTDFSTRYKLGDYAAELASVQTQQATLQSQIQALDQQIATRAGETSQLARRVQTTPPVVSLSTDSARSQQVDALTTTLLALQTERRDAAAKFRDGYPLIAALDQRIAAVQAQLRQAPARQNAVDHQGANPVRQTLETSLADVESQLAGLREGRQTLEASLAAVNARLEELVRIGPQYRELQRTRTVVEGAYNDLAKSAEDANVENSLSRSQANVRVIQSAEIPIKGESGRLILLAAGLALGCAAAFATVVLSAALSETMVAPGELEEKLRVPVLLAVNRSAEPGGRRRLKGGGVAPSVLSVEDGRLLLQLLSSVPAANGRVLQLIGAAGGEGVSTLVLDIAAIATARELRKVLVLDIEPPEGRGILGGLTARGHLATPTSEARRTFQIDDSNLFVSAPFGAGGEKVAEDRWAKAIDNARKTFDLVLIDSPALARSSAGIELAGLADMSLLVVEAEVTRAPVARRLIERTQSAGGAIIGAILNKRRFYIPRFIYGWL